jgi:hypothetical protein
LNSTPKQNAAHRRVLWAVLIINAAMFVVEVAAGLAAGSASLQADALDFLGDAANYGVSLFVVGMALRYRATAALAKGVTMGYSGCGLSERLSGTRPTERCPARSRWVRSASRRLQLIRRRSGFCGLTRLVTPICAQPGFVPEMTWWEIWPCYWPPWVCSERVLAGLTLSWPRSWPGWRCRARQL